MGEDKIFVIILSYWRYITALEMHENVSKYINLSLKYRKMKEEIRENTYRRKGDVLMTISTKLQFFDNFVLFFAKFLLI